MNMFDQFRPRRQTMQNVKPTDYVPFEDIVRTSIYQQPQPLKFQADNQNLLPVQN